MVLSQAVGGMRLGLPTHAGRHAPSLLRGASPGRSASSPAQRRRCCGQIRAVLAPAPVQQPPPQPQQAADLSQAPPFTLADLKNAIPTHCFKRKPGRSMAFLIRDVAFVVGMAVAAHAVNAWWAWPMYWMAQGTMFWALFVVGHDCGHGSFSSNKKLNDVVGNITHSSILVPYHGWRISHRTHHANHGHVENDESWYPTSKSTYDNMDALSRLGRVSFPLSLFAYPFYLMNRSPGKVGSHFDPKCDLFSPAEGKLIQESNKYFAGMLAVLAGCTLWLGPLAMLKLYAVPYWINVMWLDAVTYLHHHGPDDESIKVPWYRGEEWSYLRGGLSTLDRDYGIFNKIHHDIGTHVVHHLLPQIPHYNLCEATEAVKPVMGEYYREPEKSKGPVPFHLVPPLVRSLSSDHFVADEGNIVYYQKDPKYWSTVRQRIFGKKEIAPANL